MTELLDANIVYLDDESENLKEIFELFKGQGINIQITESIAEAKLKALDKNTQILLCDLRLKEIRTNLKGNTILRLIRTKRKDIFLALYTAYKNELSRAEINILKENEIYIYAKDDNTEFVLNLQDDFQKFKTNQAQQTAAKKTFESKISGEIASRVINHLKNVSNQELLIPIPGEDDIPIKKLIEEVAGKTEIGEQYIHIWIDTVLIINEYRKKKTK